MGRGEARTAAGKVSLSGKRVCVIGAGASGLIAARELKAAGVEEFVVLEVQEGPGGLYKRDAYEHACHTSSICYTSYACFPPEDVRQATHYTLPKYVEYLERFVEAFDLEKHIYYGTEVVSVERDVKKGTWRVAARRSTESRPRALEFEVVVCASGTHSNKEPVANHAWLEGFAGKVLHSSEFRDSSTFENKRVIVCGGGESASDVTIRAAKVASQSWIAMKARTGHITPRGPHLPETDHDSGPRIEAHLKDPERVPPEAAFDLDITMGNFSTSDFCADGLRWKDVVALGTKDFFNGIKVNLYNRSSNRTQFGCKNMGFSSAIARYGCVPKPPIKGCQGSTVFFEDGTSVDDVDVIVLAIGYKNDIGFLEPAVKEKVVNPRNCFKHVVHPEVPGFFLCGFVRPAFGNIPCLAELQGRYIAQLLTNKTQLPDSATLAEVIEADREREETQHLSAKRLKSLVSFYQYMMDMADLTDSQPDYASLLCTDPFLLLKMITGQLSGYFFKLKGASKADYDKYRAIIMTMPLATIWPFDFAVFLNSFHLFLLLGGAFPASFGLKGTTSIHKMTPGTRRALAVFLWLNPLYLPLVIIPIGLVTLILTSFVYLNSITLLGYWDRLRGLSRPAYYVAKGRYDKFHERFGRLQFVFFLMLAIPFDSIMTLLLHKHLVNQSHVPTSLFFKRQMAYKKYYSENCVLD